MPLYEYLCEHCQRVSEKVRPIEKRHDRVLCDGCARVCKLAISVPSVPNWNDHEVFHNLVTAGDGTCTFDSREAYHARMKQLDVVPVGDPVRRDGTESTTTKQRTTYPTRKPPGRRRPATW